MATRARSQTWRRLILGGLICGLAVLMAGSSCGAVDVNAVLKQLVEGDTEAAVVTLRIINDSPELTEELDVRIDGVLQRFTCEPEVGVCSFGLETLPETIAAIEERRYDADGGFEGGRSFEGLDEFTFTTGEFAEGSIIVFQLGADAANAFTL